MSKKCTPIIINCCDGDTDVSGWSPVLAVVSDGERRVHQVSDWIEGSGTKPAIGLYVGADGLVSDIADAVDIRGERGLTGPQGADAVRSDVVNGALTLYVSPSGSDATGDGTIDNPYQTIGKVADVYNGLVGVSNCTIRLMDGILDDFRRVDFYVRGNLSLDSLSADKSKAIIKGTSIYFYGGSANIANLTFDLSSNTTIIAACRPWRCFAYFNNVTFKGAGPSSTYDTRGVWTFGAITNLTDCSFTDLYIAVEATNAGGIAARNTGGDNNGIGYLAHGSDIIVNNNSMTVASSGTMKIEQDNGLIRGI